MKNQELIDYLKGCSVCPICQLRYLKARGNEYKDVKESFERLSVEYVEIPTEEVAAKKQRLTTCPTCLGLFSAEFQAELTKDILATDIAKFECDSIVVAITMPMLLQIRQLSMWFALLREFGNAIDTVRAPDVPIKEAVKLILNPIICQQLKKDYNVNGLMINITLQHSEETSELDFLKKLHAVAFPSGNGKRHEISRGLLEKQYTPAQISAKLFAEYLPIPPSLPSDMLTLSAISLTGPTVFVAGRYRKISRELSHTPWVLNGKRVMDDSIEEIIKRTLAPYFKHLTLGDNVEEMDTTSSRAATMSSSSSNQGKMIFMSSGREDVDVRCLGKGRPFVLEIPNAVRTSLFKETAYSMEQEIDKSQNVSVHNLQMVQREDLVHIKTGEEKKRKFYRALCVIYEQATPDIMKKLDLPLGFEIQQKTPIRVLHRRPLHTRPRSIYSLKAYVQRENSRVLVLDVVSQAGTYIKELVHGEYGRTTPSIASIIGQPIDIIALDVVGIDLDWPADVDNSGLSDTKML